MGRGKLEGIRKWNIENLTSWTASLYMASFQCFSTM